METSGRIIVVYPTKTFVGRTGLTYTVRDFVVEQDNKEKIMFTLWGEQVSLVENKEGERVDIKFNLSAAESNGKWFNKCGVINISFNNNKDNELYLDKKEDILSFSDDKNDNGIPF